MTSLDGINGRSTQITEGVITTQSNWMKFRLYKYQIYNVNIDLRHQYGICVAEAQTSLLAKRSKRRGARRNGCIRRLASVRRYFHTRFEIALKKSDMHKVPRKPAVVPAKLEEDNINVLWKEPV